jgi:hypothetical protein
MMEAELNALSSSNQQLRSQLELSTQQVRAQVAEGRFSSCCHCHQQSVCHVLAQRSHCSLYQWLKLCVGPLFG